MAGSLPLSLWVIGALAASPAVERLQKASAAFRDGSYAACAEAAAGLTDLWNPDVALLLEAQCLSRAGRHALAAERFGTLWRSFPESPHATLARFREADSLFEDGRETEAALSYRLADQAAPSPRADPAVGLVRRAELLERTQGDSGELWIALWRRFPGHPLTVRSLRERDRPTLTARDLLEIAQSHRAARRFGEALALLDSAPDPAGTADQASLAYWTGRTLIDLRTRYSDAAALLFASRDHAPRSSEAEEAWFWASRALSRGDRDAQSIESHLAMVARYPNGKNAAEALFYAGWLTLNAGNPAKALAILARVRQKYERSRFAEEARWFSAWCQIQTGRLTEARASLAPGLADPDWQRGGRDRYWTAVTLERGGDRAAARTAYLALLEAFPLSWYGELARLRLGAEAPPRPRIEAAENPPEIEDPLLVRGRELVDAGLGSFAALLYRAEERAFLKRHADRAGLVALMDAYREAGDFHRPWSLSVLRGGDLQRAPNAQTLPQWRHAYPACSRALIEQFTPGDADLALFLQAIMHVESGYDPTAWSTADARGLMQMLPTTAARAAAALGKAALEPDDLFAPSVNIETAAYYIGGLLRRLQRQWPLAAAAYNGGIPFLVRWLARPDLPELDAFVETIPFPETRNYVKRVTTALLRYAALEGRAPPALSLSLNPIVQSGEPSY